MKKVLLSVCLALVAVAGFSQEGVWSVKTDLVADALLNPSFTAEWAASASSPVSLYFQGGYISCYRVDLFPSFLRTIDYFNPAMVSAYPSVGGYAQVGAMWYPLTPLSGLWLGAGAGGLAAMIQDQLFTGTGFTVAWVSTSASVGYRLMLGNFFIEPADEFSLHLAFSPSSFGWMNELRLSVGYQF